MEVVPTSVGEASRRWDDERLDLRSAADGIGTAPTSGFTGTVAGTAAQFTTAWAELAAAAGTDCETRADALRTSIRDYLETDGATYADLVALRGYLGELR